MIIIREYLLEMEYIKSHWIYTHKLRQDKLDWLSIYADIAKPCNHLRLALSTSTQEISASTQLSAIPSMLLEPKYCM